MTVLCASRPPEWWETGNDGNRLARAICDVCPVRVGSRCRAGLADPAPHGVIRAGVAYADTGVVLPVCHCGYPQVDYRGGDSRCCPWCAVPSRRWHERIRDREAVDESAVERLLSGDPPGVVRPVDRREAMRRLWAVGCTHRQVADRLGMTVIAVRRAKQRMVERGQV